MLNFNIDLVVECLKVICDNTQCVTCDKLSGPCVRYPCGHSVCEGCAERAGECLFCDSSPSSSYLVDLPHTARLNNASALLSTFQDSFNIDVYKRRRISDHLKLEKQVFPDCIQAPQKYCNKRKSLNISIKNMENINQTFFPGEEVISKDTAKMKKSFQYVQNWLNQHDNIPQKIPRKPFGDININTQSLLHKEKKNITTLTKEKTQINTKKSTYMKRTHFKSINNSLLNNVTKQNLRHDMDKDIKMNKKLKKCKKNNIRHKCDKNESGIVIDDEPFVVEDVEEEIIDKDKLACMAVLEAAERDENQDNQTLSQSILQHSAICNHLVDIGKDDLDILNVNKSDNTTANCNQEILFYKKSLLSDPCKICCNYINNQNKLNTTGDNNSDISIVINNSTFVTTIKFTKCDQDKHEILNKKSVAVQTLLPHCEIVNDGEDKSQQKRKITVNDDIIPTKIIKSDIAIQSLDVFPTSNADGCVELENNDVIQNVCSDYFKPFKSVVIEDSDTESNISHDNTYEVIADVHRPSVPETVGRIPLTTLSQTEYHERSNPPLRGNTPNSTDSSDKENRDPNRTKHAKYGKKQKHKINK